MITHGFAAPQLRFLDTGSIQDQLAFRPSVFEKVSHFEFENNKYAVYSIRKPEFSGNPRILFSVIGDTPDNLTILLLAFHELKKSDYSRSIPVAISRMISMIDGNE